MTDTIPLPAVGDTVTFRTASRHGLSAPRTGTVKQVEDRGAGKGGGIRIIVQAGELTFKVRPGQIVKG